MSRIEKNNIILTEEETRNLIHNLLHPNEEAIKKRDAFLKGAEHWKFEFINETTFTVDIPELDLSNISDKSNSLT